jgi:hypothetical protein
MRNTPRTISPFLNWRQYKFDCANMNPWPSCLPDVDRQDTEGGVDFSGVPPRLKPQSRHVGRRSGLSGKQDFTTASQTWTGR